MQVLGVFGFEVLDESLLSLPAELRRASIGLTLETLLALLFVLFRILVHVREGHWEGHWTFLGGIRRPLAPQPCQTQPRSSQLFSLPRR